MKSNKWNYIFITIATLALFFFIYVTNDIHQLKTVLLSANILWLFVAVICMFLYWLFESGVLYCTANSIKSKLSFHKAFRTTMVGQLFNNITPFASGGQPIQAYYLIKETFQLGEASSILLMKFIIYQSAMVLYSGTLLTVKLTFFVGKISSIGYLAIIGFGINVLVILFLLAIGFFPSITKRIVGSLIHLLSKLRIIRKKEFFLEKMDHQIQSFQEGFSLLIVKKSLLVKSILITFLQLTAFFFIPFCICMSLGIKDAEILTIVAASAFVMMISSFVPLPGASGGAEGSFYIFFGIFIINPAITAVAIVLWRLITFYLPILVGIFYCKIANINQAVYET